MNIDGTLGSRRQGRQGWRQGSLWSGGLALAAVGMWSVLAVPAGAAGSPCGSVTPVVSGDTTTCTYTAGGLDSFTVPAGVSSITVVANGAGGGADFTGSPGGPGGQTQGVLSVTAGSTYSLQVATAGGDGLANSQGVRDDAGGAGGLPGGGVGGGGFHATVNGGGGGGGATLFGTGDLGIPSNWLLVAGGGGGGGGFSAGGAGGGLRGGDGSAGSGGDQTGTTGSHTQLYGSAGAESAGGGGGGYWGGGGGNTLQAGGGGSGFVASSIAGTTTTGAGSTGDGSITISWQAFHYNFTQFLAPIANGGVFNAVKAGQAVPVKFSLGGYQGMNVLAQGSPTSQAIACSGGASSNVVEETATAGGSGLSYDASTDQYSYVWKTDKAWANSCRQLTVTLSDGIPHTALFSFTR